MCIHTNLTNNAIAFCEQSLSPRNCQMLETEINKWFGLLLKASIKKKKEKKNSCLDEQTMQLIRQLRQTELSNTMSLVR